MFTQTIHSPKIEINAPVAHVWAILTDLERYEAWNSFVPKMTSTLKPGDPITIHVQMNPRMNYVVHEVVTVVEPERTLAWGTTYPRWLLHGERYQELAPLGSDRCTYASHETFTGVMVPLLMGLLKRDITAGFAAVATGLKEYAEQTV